MNEKEIAVTDVSRYIVLAIYDIADNKRRQNMVKCLSRYAVRVQKSWFEGILTTKQCSQMEKYASRIINDSEDSLRIYRLRDHTKVKSWGRGHIETEDVVIF